MYILYFVKRTFRIVLLIFVKLKNGVYSDYMLSAIFCAFINKWLRFIITGLSSLVTVILAEHIANLNMSAVESTIIAFKQM